MLRPLPSFGSTIKTIAETGRKVVALLEIEELRTQFFTTQGTVKAVDGIT